MQVKVNRILENYSQDIHGHNLMGASIGNGHDVTEFMRIARESGRDAIVLSSPGCVIVNGDSKAMQETIAKFGALRQDVNLTDGQAVATYWPAPGMNAQTLVQSMRSYYGERAAVEQCMQMGVDSIDTKHTVAVAMSGVSGAKASEVTQVLASEFNNALTVTRDGYHFHAFTQLDPVVTEQLSNMGYNQMSSQNANSPVADFRFDSYQEMQQFLRDAETLSTQRVAELAAQEKASMESSVKILPREGITIIQAHQLSMPDATSAVSKIGDAHNNAVVLKSMDGTKDNMNIMVSAESQLGQALMAKYENNLTGSHSPSVATFHFNDANEIVNFLRDANDIGKDINMEQANDNMDINLEDGPDIVDD